MLKPCSFPGCPHLVTSGTCPEHTNAEPAMHHRAWATVSAAHLATWPYCERCGKRAALTDHVVARGDPAPIAECSTCGRSHRPLQSLCHRCHRSKTHLEDVVIRPAH